MPDYDAIVIGAGHNGLVCGGYLAKHGLRTLIIERRELVGGCCTTEELIPGFRFDVGAASHIWIRTTPVIRDLGLERFGLKYIELDPMIFAPYEDGRHIEFYKDIRRTVHVIEKLSKYDAKSYQRLYEFWRAAATVLDAALLSSPITINDMFGVLGEEGEEVTRLLLTSARKILEEEFETEYVKSQIAWIGATAGLSPSELGTGGLIGHHFMLHDVGIARPVGGSGALTYAMQKAFEGFGGEVILNETVKGVLVERRKAVGVELNSGRKVSGRVIVSAVDPKQALLKLLPHDVLPDELRKKVESIRIINGMGIGTYLATDELPRYLVDPSQSEVTYSKSLQSICPSVEYIEESYSDAALGRLSSNYSMHISTPTAVDSSLAPPGKHLVWIWSMFAPFRLVNRGSWAAAKDSQADKIVEILAQHAPNLKKSILDRRIFTPPDYQNMLAIPNGQYGHIDMCIDQMYAFRPLREFADYHGPVESYYLTGAGTHPGGGVFGAPGHNTAMEILSDLRILRAKKAPAVRKMVKLYKSIKQMKRSAAIMRNLS